MSPAATKSARSRPAYRCAECGWTTPKWVGRCGECQAWGTVEEAAERQVTARAPAALAPSSPARPIHEVDVDAARARSTGVGELDRVLGGGIVPGAVVLLAGEPGVGKSTLLLDVAARAAEVSAADGAAARSGAPGRPGAPGRSRATGGSGASRAPGGSGGGRPVLYVTGEESASQVRLRAERIGALTPNLLLAAETDLATLLGHVEAAEPSLLVVDSVQTIADGAIDGSAGGVSQVRAVAGALINVAKTRDIPVLLVGHVTKDGSIAGPRVLEHLVDVVCQFEGDRHSRLRMVRAVKNRYGPTDEVGCFDLGDAGITGLPDPSGLFLSEVRQAVPGTCVTVSLEGRRPMPTEIQALVAPSSLSSPRRTTSGVDSSRVAMTLAVLQSRLGVNISASDIYVSTVGGARAVEPAVDLAVALALLSAATQRPLDPKMIAVGEVGLTGDVRTTVGVQRRLGEAARLGFTKALVPAQGAGDLQRVPGMTIRPVENLYEAVELSGAAELS